MIWISPERTDIPKYHEDVTTYRVTREGKHIGVLFIVYPRESKRGSWCGALGVSAGIWMVTW